MRKSNKLAYLVVSVFLLAMTAYFGGFKFSFFDFGSESKLAQLALPAGLSSIDSNLDNGMWGKYSSVSNLMKIGDYEINAIVTDTANANGCVPASTGGRTCYTEVTIKKSGNVVKQANNCGAMDDGSKRVFNNVAVPVDGTLSISKIYVMSPYSQNCKFSELDYEITIPKDSINISVATPQSQYFQGQDLEIMVYVINNWMESDGLLTVEYKTPTIIGDKATTEKKEIHIAKGKNTYYFKIPTSVAAEKLIITPSVEIIFKKDTTTGLNQYMDDTDGYSRFVSVNSAKYAELAKKDYISLGKATEKSFEVMIIPRPMYMKPNADGSCDSGYSKNADGSYCLDDNLSKLPCYVIAPPVVEGHDYVCSSYGIWTEIVYQVETVYKDIWGTCPANSDTITNPNNSTYCVARCAEGTSTTTAVDGSRICIKTEVAEKILGCTASSTPPALCKGMTASCVTNGTVQEWHFDGKCDVITETQTKEVVKEVIVEKPIVKEITNTITVETVPQWIYGIIIVLIIITAIALNKRR